MSKQFQLKIYDKKLKILVINHSNKDRCTETIEKALRSGLLIKFNDDLQKNIKQHFMIIQSISFRLIINSKIEGYFPLSIYEIMNASNRFKSVAIQNINVCLKMIWQNPLNIKQWMSDKKKWQLLFTFLLKLLKQHPKSIMRENINLILTIMNTNIYWNDKHFLYLIHHEFCGIFAKFFRCVYITTRITKNDMKKTSSLWSTFLNTSKIFSMYYYFMMKRYGIDFNLWTQPIWNSLALEYCKECDLERQLITNDGKYVHKNVINLYDKLMKFITYVKEPKWQPILLNGSISISQKCKIISKKYKIFSRIKLCANINCKQRNNRSKFKICKKCRMVYYCSKHCQKVDWKNTHKKECLKLYMKMNGFN